MYMCICMYAYVCVYVYRHIYTVHVIGSVSLENTDTPAKNTTQYTYAPTIL